MKSTLQRSGEGPGLEVRENRLGVPGWKGSRWPREKESPLKHEGRAESRIRGRGGGSGLEQNCFPCLGPGVLVFLATCDGQCERFKWTAIELLRFAASLIGPDHGVETVLLVTFNAVGTVSLNSLGMPSHGLENQLHPSLYVSGPTVGRFFIKKN